MKLTIIGGAGFIGTNLCQNLYNRQTDFEIIDLKTSKRFPEFSKIGDVRDIDSLRRTISGKVVILLAAAHRDDIDNVLAYDQTNVLGAMNVAKVCSENNIKRIIFTSSVAVYGFAKPETDESGKILPFNDYGRTKYEAEKVLREWQQKCTTRQLLIIRPTVVFGEGNRGNVFNLFKQVANKRFVMVGNGKNVKSIAYVGNLVAFIETCISTKQPYGLFNYVDEPNLSLNALVTHTRKTLGIPSDLKFHIPFWIGLTIGYCAELAAICLGKKFAINSIRIRKFCATTHFLSSKDSLDQFSAPYTLPQALERTLTYEFLSQNKDREIFDTE
jgi:nucleoside-diphosphate-sugar epimerase